MKTLSRTIVGNLQCRKSLRGARADIENELIAVAEFHKEAGHRLGHARKGHAGTARDDSHFFRRQGLAVGGIEIAL